VTPQDAEMTQHSASMNLIDNNSEEKLYRFTIRKTKIPPKTMQRIQISQMIEPVDSKTEIWLVIPSNEIPENLLCEEQTASSIKYYNVIFTEDTTDPKTCQFRSS
jgi:hypothetical protein